MPLYASSDRPAVLTKMPVGGSIKVDSLPDCDPRYYVVDYDVVREMTAEEKAETYPDEAMTLDTAKELKIAAIDARTAYLIKIGFVWSGKHFSMSDAAQRNWIGFGTAYATGLIATNQDGSFVSPLEISTVDEDKAYLTSVLDLKMFLGAYMMYQMSPVAPLGSGRALKALVNACTTVAEVEAIVDGR